VTLCICGKEIIAYYADGENPSMWLHTAYGQPECLSTQIATPAEPEALPSVECVCGASFTGTGREYELEVHGLGCRVIQNLTTESE
jgi:hypothetical protein